MDLSALRDLNMAGVQWELTELPSGAAAEMAAAAEMVARVAARPASHIADEIQIPLSPLPDNARTPVFSSAPAIVPPLTPLTVDTAVAAAARPVDADALCRMIAEFNHPLRATAKNTVLPHVAPKPCGVLVVTDIPGPDDDAAGCILSGAAGALFDKMIGAIGLGRDSVSIMPVLFWRTPGGRAATRGELDLARPFVDRMIEMLNPRIIITLGTTATTEIAHVDLAKNHGADIETSGRHIVPIFHPNYLMLKASAKRDAWTALQMVQNMLKNA